MVEGAIALVVVVLVGLLGWHFYDARQKTSGVKTQTTSPGKLEGTTTSFPTNELSYTLPSNFTKTTAVKPFSGNDNITEEYSVDIQSKDLAPPPQGLPCTVSTDHCQQPYEDVSIKEYLLSSDSETLQQFASAFNAAGQLSGVYTTLNGYQAYCQQAADGSQKQLAPLPAKLPWQVFWGYGCDLKLGGRIYQVKVVDNSSKQKGEADYQEAIKIVQSIKLVQQ